MRVRANTGDDDHQSDEGLENSPTPGAAAPHLASMGSPPLSFHHPASYAAAASVPRAPVSSGDSPS